MDILLYLLAAIIVMIAQMRVTGAYQRYKNISNARGLTGAEAARRVLNLNGLNYVRIEHAQGTLADHYDPRSQTVRLSDEIYYGNSIASISVACHECGHAIQHAENYGFIAIRNSILPICSISNSLAWPVLMMGIFFAMDPLVYIGIILLSAVLIFQIVTLPVEFNASSRAMNILSDSGMIIEQERQEVKSMLSAAAMTYVAAVISSALQILRFLLIANRNRRR